VVDEVTIIEALTFSGLLDISYEYISSDTDCLPDLKASLIFWIGKSILETKTFSFLDLLVPSLRLFKMFKDSS